MPKYKYVSNAALRLASFPSHVRKGDDDADFLTCFSVVVLLALDATNQHKHHKSVNKHHRRDYTPTNIPPASQHNETFNAKTNDCSSRSKTTRTRWTCTTSTSPNIIQRRHGRSQRNLHLNVGRQQSR
mmetsp:Transcript_21752/g.61894  ORF Transcript_21752/g.61894 Transcript_21752/m.61894 type:complete len:128 (+) Transcript_21752:161-544(+)